MGRVKTATEALNASREMAQTGKPESEEYDLVVIQSATQFVAAMKLGTGAVTRSERVDMLGGAFEALLMERAYSRPRQALVYAVLPSGSMTLVPRAVWEELGLRAETWCRNGGDQKFALLMKPDFSLMPKRKK